MVAEVVEKLVPIRCIGYRKDGSRCEQVLMKVRVEHVEMVKERIQIKCYRCNTVQ